MASDPLLGRRRTAEGTPHSGGAPPVDRPGQSPGTLPTSSPPSQPPGKDPGEWGEGATPDVSIVFEITKAAVDLQFRIAERLDVKARNYFAAAATLYGVAQALVLRDDVRQHLGDKAGTISALAIASAVVLALALV